MNTRPPRHRQAGITAIGFLILAAVFGAIGFAILKIVPLYLERMRISSVLDDIKSELVEGGNTPQTIRSAIEARFNIENLSVPREFIEIARQGEGYAVSLNKESRASFVADLWFVLVIDKQIELPR